MSRPEGDSEWGWEVDGEGIVAERQHCNSCSASDLGSPISRLADEEDGGQPSEISE